MMEYGIDILLFDDVEPLDFCGPFEVFAMAGRLVGEHKLPLATVAAKPLVKTVGSLTIVPDRLFTDAGRGGVLVVPGGQGTRREMHNQALLDWLRERAAEADIVLSVCTGALLLGAAGLLDGMEATTHYGALDLLREIAPTCRVVEGARYVDSGKVVCAAGVAAGIDASLYVVSRMFGPDVAGRTASQMEYDWGPASA